MAFADFAYGVNQSIQQLLLQRELERMGVSPAQLAQAKLLNEQRTQNRADQELQLRQKEYDQNQARMLANDQSLAQQRIAGEGEKAAEAIPGNAILEPTDTGAAKMEAAGLGGLLTKNTTLPSTQMTGTDLGRLTTRSVPSDKQVQSLTKLPTEKQTTTIQAAKDREQAHADAQANAQATNALRQSTEENTNAYRTSSLAETSRHNRAMENKPSAAATVTIQTVDDQGNPVTKIVPKVAGSEFKKAPGATVENRLSSAQAVQDVGNDIITQLSNPAVAAMLGPAMGRYNTLRDFIGNPPPELSKLAGEIESYSLANMGVHGMRSVVGAQQISSLLDRKHTPQSLIAAIQGLNGFSRHYMENEGRGGRTPDTTPPPPASGGTFKVIGVQP